MYYTNYDRTVYDVCSHLISGLGINYVPEHTKPLAFSKSTKNQRNVTKK